MISGLFFGFAFGIGRDRRRGARPACDHTSIEFVYRLCAYLPALGLLTAWLPGLDVGDRSPHAGRIEDAEAVGI